MAKAMGTAKGKGKGKARSGLVFFAANTAPRDCCGCPTWGCDAGDDDKLGEAVVTCTRAGHVELQTRISGIVHHVLATSSSWSGSGRLFSSWMVGWCGRRTCGTLAMNKTKVIDLLF